MHFLKTHYFHIPTRSQLKVNLKKGVEFSLLAIAQNKKELEDIFENCCWNDAINVGVFRRNLHVRSSCTVLVYYVLPVTLHVHVGSFGSCEKNDQIYIIQGLVICSIHIINLLGTQIIMNIKGKTVCICFLLFFLLLLIIID